jgi:hypothetical protein
MRGAPRANGGNLNQTSGQSATSPSDQGDGACHGPRWTRGLRRWLHARSVHRAQQLGHYQLGDGGFAYASPAYAQAEVHGGV